MDAFKKNKFLSAYLGGLVVGVLVLGWLFYSSLSDHTSAAEEYASTKAGVEKLRTMPAFPDEANYKARRAQADEYAGQVSELQKKVLGSQKPLNTELKSAEFQTKLKDRLDTLEGQAGLTKLGAKKGDFDLGMTKYRSDNPREQAVAELDFELEGLKSLVETMIADRVSSIDTVTRSELAIEAANAAVPAVAAGAKRPAAGAAKAGGPPALLPEDSVLKRYPFTIRFSGTNRSVQEVLNHLASAPDFLYAVRSIRVENEKKEGPNKSLNISDANDTKKKDSQIVLGGEKVTVWMAIDLLRFLEPAAPADAKTPAKKAP